MNYKKIVFSCIAILGILFSSTSCIFVINQNAAVGFNMKIAYMITICISFAL